MKDLDLSMVILNAGLLHMGPFEGYSGSSIQQTLDTNMYHVAMLARLLIPQLIARKKRCALIVNSSMIHLTYFPGASMYCASKAFATQFTEGLTKDYADNDLLDIQCLNPFGTATNITSHKGLQMVGTPSYKVIQKSLNDLGRSKEDCLQYGTALNEACSRVTMGWLKKCCHWLMNPILYHIFTYVDKTSK